MGEYLLRNKIFIYSHKILINYKRRNSNFIVEKPGGYHLHQVIKVNITSNKTIWHHGPRYNALRRNQHPFCGIAVPNAQPESNHEEIAEKVKLKDSPQNNWPVFFKNVSHERQRKAERNYSRFKETRDMTTKWNTWFWIGP